MSVDQRMAVRAGTWMLAVMPGDIDAASAPGLGGELKLLLSRQHGTVLVVDMTHTRFCDCAGVRMLLLAHQQATRQDCELRIVTRSPSVRKVLQLTGVEQVLPVFSAMDQALAGAPAGCVPPMASRRGSGGQHAGSHPQPTAIRPHPGS